MSDEKNSKNKKKIVPPKSTTKKTVFISSTFEDLINYRRKIWELLEDYEVNIRGMERFGARKEAPLETCISEVEQCEIFIGIIAFKLGSIDKSSGKSFTQREYETAYKLNQEILIYIVYFAWHLSTVWLTITWRQRFPVPPGPPKSIFRY
jgi:hypothetical protein